MNNTAHSELRDFAGRYNKITSGKQQVPQWENDKIAIWFKTKAWQIGRKEELGRESSNIQSIQSTPCPETKDTKWDYSPGSGQWNKGGEDVKVVKFEGKLSHSNNCDSN